MARNQLGKLFKQLLNESGKFVDYNFRGHAVRRVKYNYEKHLEETNEQKLSQLIHQAQEDLQVLQRQVTIGSLYRAEKHILDPAT